MALFKIGDKVLRDGSNEIGTIIAVPPARRGRQIYNVTWGTHTCDELEDDLRPNFDISDPFERCSNGVYGTYSEYSKKNTSFKIQSSNNSTVSSLKASKTLFRAYQFKPLLKFLNSPNRRLLVADEVGLGKTIEAGHIMMELKARKELHNVLIICPKSLQTKWKGELLEKFGLSFKIYDNPKELGTDMNEKPGQVHAIVNYEKIRLKKKSSSKTKEEQGKADSLIEYLTDSGRKFSLVLCDEAHKLRNQGTQTYKGAEILMSLADAVLFLTATPVMISTENLYNLMHLLDNTRFFNYQIFDNLLRQNRPFIDAITSLNHNEPLNIIKDNLENAEVTTSFSSDDNQIYSKESTIGTLLKNDDIYQEIISLLTSEDTLQHRARLQYLLSTMSIMNNYFSRTRKREVTMDMSQAERSPHLCKVVLTDYEREHFDRVIEDYIDDNSYTDYWGEEVMTQGGALGLVQKKRQVASSVFAYMNTEENLDNGIDAFSAYPDAKVDELIRIIEEVFKHGTKKIVVFALFRKTLKYLALRLKNRGYGSHIIHGLVKDRDLILNDFKNNPNAHILLSSEVGSEGLDLQFCNSMVNFDLPWNPMVVEQRIGRIDRFGQKSPVVNIYNIVVADSIQEDIYIRLLDRIGIFKGTIGDMEAILDAPFKDSGKLTIQDVYNKLEKELFTTRLSAEEYRRKVTEIERAIENEKENIRQFEDGLTNAITNDAYFRDEINRIIYNKAYVDEIELKNYIDSVIRKELTTCELVPAGDKIYEFRLPMSNANILKNFLIRYQPSGDEFDALFRGFLRSIEDSISFRLTFNQEKAYEDRSLAYINIYHPIIYACLNYFIATEDKNKTTFSYSVEHNELLESGHTFFLGVYKLSTSRMVQGVKKISETLFPVAYDANLRAMTEDQRIVDSLFGLSQTDGEEHNPSNEFCDKELVQDLRYSFIDAVHEAKEARLQELTRQAESERKRNEQQTREYYHSLIANREKQIDEWEYSLQYSYLDDKEKRNIEGAIRLGKANIDKYRKDLDQRLSIINSDPGITINEELISINLVTVQ